MPGQENCWQCGSLLSPQATGKPSTAHTFSVQRLKGPGAVWTPWVAAGIALFVVFAIVGVLSVRTRTRDTTAESDAQARLRASYTRLAARVPNLRMFPGWGKTDDTPLFLSQCKIMATGFTGDA